MSDAILVLNAGSSSLKFSLFHTERGDRRLVGRGQVEGIGTSPRFVLYGEKHDKLEEHHWETGEALDHDAALAFALDRCRARFEGMKLVAVGHRVVHGGVAFAKPVLVTEEVLAELERLVPLAPLHQPHNLAAIRAALRRSPGLPQVACFDTAFHRTQPEVAQRFGLPRRYTDEGILRYGFHGLSYEYIASVLSRYDPRAAAGKTIVAHLGNGASLCAMLAGRSVATTMSFTPLDGLVMGTRVGALDPGVVLYLMDRHGLDARALESLLWHESGLLGVSGVSSDMRDLLASPNPHAAEAVELFVYRIVREIGSLTAALGGLDALVFTAGIGENAPDIRSRVCRASTWLGIDLDEEANAKGGPRIGRPDSRIAVWVIPTDEEAAIVAHTELILGKELSKG